MRLLLLVCATLVQSLVQSLPSSEGECLSLVGSTSGSRGTEVFVHAMRSAWWNCTAVLASESGDVNELLDIFNMEQRMMHARLTTLKGTIEALKPMPQITPAVQWAQSVDFIYLNVKFSHIISAPATLNVEERSVVIDGRRLLVECSDGKKVFKLDLEFEGEILAAPESSWSMGSVGRMTFNLKKAEAPNRWSKVLLGKGKGQVTRWTDLQERYDKELSQLKPSSSSDDTKKEKEKEIEKEKEKEKEEKDKEDKGTIVTPEQEARKQRRASEKLKEAEAKKKLDESLASIDAELKKAKRDLDFEVATKRRELEKDAEARKSALRSGKSDEL